MADGGVVSADAEAGEVARAEGRSDGFETIIAAAGAFGAVADLAEFEIEIVADDENVVGGEFVKMDEFLDGAAGKIVEILGFEEDAVTVFGPESAKFGFLPVEVVDFGIEIECQKADIVTGEIVFGAGIAEADEEFHRVYYNIMLDQDKE